MSSNLHRDRTHLTCEECTDRLQEYLDGTLVKEASLQVFLHLRECEACECSAAEWKNLFAALEDLPTHAPSAGFDQRVLDSVPYAAYRAMEPLRRDRVPVFLESDALPDFVRSPVTRGLGAAVALILLVGTGIAGWPREAMVGAGLGLVPEILVRLQAAARHLVLSARRSERSS